ncbi:alpha/beta fold hydrolase [Echinicola vietnamensis]|uniref:Putative hydrolase or acyltransferase of alpha/beta superfamily n=1 Tax=Echinicola vietnamensis (strain DSM 17526 / LMG 23754 / KMM 6221) TaxID=926556 RepID=L0FW94_ECHVK|nr:alpha/beta fold hydrolase [Echinicola vietnamensis]AGA76940.1 putative hydrolase or acyltransferase of alpha/beta superfamily [Echinicola vietnamensis DSM 17526]
MKLNYKKVGQGKPLIILHGLFGSADNWLSIAKELEEDYTMYLVDQRNHGDSPHSEEWSYKSMVDDLAAFMTSQGLEAAYIMGHSMGGKTAMNFALKYPNKVQKLIIADIAPRYYPPHHENILAGLNAIDMDHLASRKEADETLAEHIPEMGIRQFLMKSLGRDENRKFVWKINLPVITEKIDNVGAEIESDKSYAGPTLFMRGANSDYIQEKDKEDLEKYFPEYKLITIKNAGHWLHAEQPDAVVETIKAFLG